MPKIKDSFIKKYPEYDQVVLQLLNNRGLTKEEEIKNFLRPEYNKAFNPFLFKDMAFAVDLIIKHIKSKNKIIVYGDYDADGVTASALLFEVLKILKAKINIYIPDRVCEGYGLNKEAIDKITKKKIKLIITVDGGIRNQAEVEYAKSNGLDIIITDHHVPPKEKVNLPDCLIINPLVSADNYPYKSLAGVGVAFKLAKAVISKSKLSAKDKKALEEKILDLVAIGTVADCVSLLAENRILVKKGLEILNQTTRIGLQELIQVAKINQSNSFKANKKLETWNIGFQIGPRLNAAGRMEHANTAFELLITENKKEAAILAKRLNDRNMERQKVTEEIVQEVEKQVDLEDNDKIIIGICPKHEIVWNEGVVGLVAGRISEKYYLPVLIITKTKDGFKGSGRSVSELNLIKAIEDCGELLDKYGGHPAACGFSLTEKNLDKFKEKIKKIAKDRLAKNELRPKIRIESKIKMDDINNNLLEQLEKFRPFGQDNPQPKFMSQNILINDIMTMGVDNQHIKFRFNGFWGLAFGKAEEWGNLRIGDKVDIVYYVEKNEFNGRSEVQLKVVDMRITHNS